MLTRYVSCMYQIRQNKKGRQKAHLWLYIAGAHYFTLVVMIPAFRDLTMIIFGGTRRPRLEGSHYYVLILYKLLSCFSSFKQAMYSSTSCNQPLQIGFEQLSTFTKFIHTYQRKIGVAWAPILTPAGTFSLILHSSFDPNWIQHI